jgi:hypothetical protein
MQLRRPVRGNWGEAPSFRRVRDKHSTGWELNEK